MVDENLNIIIETEGTDKVVTDIGKIDEVTKKLKDTEEEITDAYRERIKAMMDIEKVSDNWIRTNKTMLDQELQIYESSGKGENQKKKELGTWGKIEDKIKHVSVRKEQLISVMGQLVTGSGNVTNSIGSTIAGFSTMGLVMGAGIMMIGNMVSDAAKLEDQNKKLAASFILTSDAMKEGGYAAIGYESKLNEIIESNRKIGSGIALTGEAGGGSRVSNMVDTAVASLTAQMEAQGKSHEEITAALKTNKSKIEDYATATEAVSAAQRELDKTTGDDVVTMMKKKVLTEALNTAIARQKDTLENVTTAFGGLIPAINGIQQWFQTLKGSMQTQGVVKGQAFGAGLGLGDYSQRWRPGATGGGGAARMKVNVPVPGGMEPLIPELPGYEDAVQRGGLQQAKQTGGVKKAVDNFGRDLAETTANQVANGLVQAFQAEKPKEALSALFMTVLNSLFAAGIGKVIGMAFGGPALHTGGYYSGGAWKSFAGGGDMGSWVSSPMGILGSKGNALVGDAPELVLNIPQLQRLMGGMMAQGGTTVNNYMQGLIGQTRVGEGVRTAYRDSQARQGKVTR